MALTGAPQLKYGSWQFPKLPLELRICIWKQAAIGRIIKITAPRRSHDDSCDVSEIHESRPNISYVKPPIFEVNKESRDVALKFYEIAFSDHPNIRPFYFAYSIDALLCGTCLLSTDLTGAVECPDAQTADNTLNKIKHLMLKGVLDFRDPVLETYPLKFFKSVQHLTLTRKWRLGDTRRARYENRTIDYFKKENITLGARTGRNIEFMSESDMKNAPTTIGCCWLFV
ncbi:hypothetical protein DL98DRAFT_584384 [Cadophora sp. DSE1049]|nr:hypothetical protein DL98DRAFT_584384 [Cadophora sp. DSE1049]